MKEPKKIVKQSQQLPPKKILKVRTATNKPTTTTVVNKFVVVVGFEVNFPDAFVTQDNGWVFESLEKTQKLDVDYGHAFFYVTKNHIVEVFFSFGPNGRGKNGWFNQGGLQGNRQNPPNKYNKGAVVKNGASSSRKGTPDYQITEVVTLYRMVVSEYAANEIIKETNKIRKEINDGDQKYTAWVNDTCAETAYDILEPFISNLPKGKGAVDKSGAPTLNVINPYMWHYNFTKSQFSKYEIIYPAVEKISGIGVISSGHKLVKGWFLKPKDIDPLCAEGYIK